MTEAAPPAPSAGIRAGSLTALFLYDVAEEVRLATVGTLVGSAVPARLEPRPGTPPSVQYQQAPLSIDGEALGLAEVVGCRPRFKVYDYGVVSVALIQALP